MSSSLLRQALGCVDVNTLADRSPQPRASSSTVKVASSSSVKTDKKKRSTISQAVSIPATVQEDVAVSAADKRVTSGRLGRKSEALSQAGLMRQATFARELLPALGEYGWAIRDSLEVDDAPADVGADLDYDFETLNELLLELTVDDFVQLFGRKSSETTHEITYKIKRSLEKIGLCCKSMELLNAFSTAIVAQAMDKSLFSAQDQHDLALAADMTTLQPYTLKSISREIFSDLVSSLRRLPTKTEWDKLAKQLRTTTNKYFGMATRLFEEGHPLPALLVICVAWHVSTSCATQNVNEIFEQAELDIYVDVPPLSPE